MKVYKHMNRISQEKIDSIYHMTIAGKTINDIVIALGVHHTTVSRRRKLMNINCSDIYSLKS